MYFCYKNSLATFASFFLLSFFLGGIDSRIFSSVVVLAPASLYLEEAFEVLHFPHASRYDFYAGCLLSGVLGLFLNLSFMKVRFSSFIVNLLTTRIFH